MCKVFFCLFKATCQLLNVKRIFWFSCLKEETWEFFWAKMCSCCLLHYVRFSRFYWHFLANLVMYIYSMLQVYIIAIWSQGLLLNFIRSYATFGTKIPLFRANSGCLLGTKWQKWWIYKNVSRIMKIVHSAVVPSSLLLLPLFLISSAAWSLIWKKSSFVIIPTNIVSYWFILFFILPHNMHNISNFLTFR